MTEAIIIQRLGKLEDMLSQLLQNQGEWLTASQVCDRFGICRTTLHTWRKDRGFPAPGIGGKYLLSEVLAWEGRKHKTKC